jgi:class 3 adenylate cyclase
MESRQHSCGFRILEAECPALFQALRAGQALAIEDVSKDVRTVGLEEAHMGSGECKSLLSVPVRLRNQLIGFVWIEDRPTSVERLSESRTFALALANVIAAQFALSPPQEDLQNTSFVAPTAPVVASASGASARRSVAAVSSSRTPASPIAMRTASLIDERNRRFLREATRRGLEGGQLGATLFPHTTVLVLRIADDLALAAKDGDRENGTVFETIVKVCQMAATEYDIPYMKVVNQEIVAAGGFTTDSEATAITVADFALDAQEALSRVLADVQAPTAYAMGIDTGPALGSPVGLGRLAYNLWGQAVRIASQMAATARPGTIQVTETTGEQLRDRYLLRRRGGFYLEESGEVTIYALGARL